MVQTAKIVPNSRDKWESPSTNMQKINVDTSITRNINGGAGAVIRDELGLILAAAAWPILFALKTHEAEDFSAYLGLKFANESCLNEVVLENDNLEVVKALKHDLWVINEKTTQEHIDRSRSMDD
ncbi:hypothetical protein PIB30_063608 [Stylosanthes scabra]|uniref:RNase H type-1 domain-containing protein n=1 Tax=Stylosanthes scabra TaxID=79078 RepID=A0ABU6WLD6_9FABA|nr:hypothetical protein [Stylosanthes scabra]